MKRGTLPLLRCPACRGELELRTAASAEKIDRGSLLCNTCRSEFAIENGVPQFVQAEELRGLNRQLAHFYDGYSALSRPISSLATALLGGEQKVRAELLGRLNSPAGRFLDVGIGAGRNLPFIVRTLNPTQLLGVDISRRQIQACQRVCSRQKWDVELAAAMAEALPFADNSFDTVLHVGGINFFSNQSQAVREMVRVARPGAQILIADETERAAKVFDWILPGFSRKVEGKRRRAGPPAGLLPANVNDVRTDTIWRGMAYCLQFRKASAGVMTRSSF